jgi:hypothetical protein
MKTPQGLQALIDDGVIDEVIRPLKSGKEAAVYVVRAGEEIRCAKVYKDLRQRSFQARAQYQEGRKVRFPFGRRVLYVDAALAPADGRFFCGFSDALIGTGGVVLGDSAGRVCWSHEVEAPLARVAVSPDAHLLAAGLQDGRLFALDPSRRSRWEHVQSEPVAALAVSSDGAVTLAGTEAGGLLCLDEEGALRWKTTS